MLTAALKSKVDSLWDKFWSGGIANPLTAIEQISYLLFMRRLDAVDQKAKEDAEWLKRPYKSIFDGKYKHIDGKDYPKKALRWAEFRHLPGEDMLSFVRDHVFPFIKNLSGEDHPFSKYMKDAVFIVPKASLLVEAIGIIDDIYNEIERERQENSQTFHDTQGDLYEYLLSEIATAGKNGQFRTPRHIIQMMCALVDPKLGEEICDPACGTGGFLLGAYQHILTQHTSKKLRTIDENGLERGLVGDKLTDDRQWKALKEKTFFGYDFDTTMVRIGLMNLITHGIDHPNLEYQDTLSKRFDTKDRFDVVLANPPFKGSIDKGDVSEELTLSTKKTELLFLELFTRLLRIGGRAAVIIPTGVLDGTSKLHLKLRKQLLEGNDVQAVIGLPHYCFKPYASVATAILIFVKGGRTERTWFYDLERDGFSEDGSRKRVDSGDLPDLLLQWNARRSEDYQEIKGKHGWASKSEIVQRQYNLLPKENLRSRVSKGTIDVSTIGQLCELKKGTTGAMKALPGIFPFVTTAEELKSHNEGEFEGPAVCIPLVSSTGHGHASIKRLTFIEQGKFAAATIIAVLTVKFPDIILPAYLFYYLESFKDDVIVPLTRGAANVSLTIPKIASIEIPIPSIEQQKQLIDQIISFDTDLRDQKKLLNSLLDRRNKEIDVFKEKMKRTLQLNPATSQASQA